jgi:hypothetical protein
MHPGHALWTSCSRAGSLKEEEEEEEEEEGVVY